MAVGKTNIGGSESLDIKGVLGGFVDAAYSNTTKITKTGKGVLTSITSVVGQVQGAIWVDGVLKCNFIIPSGNLMIACLIPYTTSLEIKTNNANAFFASFSTGSTDLKKGVPVIDKYNYTTTVATSLIQTVSGKGFVHAIKSTGNGRKLVLDGVTIIDYQVGVDVVGTMLRFNSSLNYYSTYAFGITEQAMYTLD